MSSNEKCRRLKKGLKTNKSIAADWLATPLSYLVGCRYKSRPGDQLFWQMFLSLYSQMPAQYLALGHDRFLPYPFQFSVHTVDQPRVHQNKISWICYSHVTVDGRRKRASTFLVHPPFHPFVKVSQAHTHSHTVLPQAPLNFKYSYHKIRNTDFFFVEFYEWSSLKCITV
jgi:hypothetical protein